ncbi:unnamed protein product, partial [Eretmochelys imbricata]
MFFPHPFGQAAESSSNINGVSQKWTMGEPRIPVMDQHPIVQGAAQTENKKAIPGLTKVNL